jgi:flagellar hook assembly protein FlgD
MEVTNDGQPLVIDFEFNDGESWEIVDQSGNAFKCSNVQELELSGETVQWILRKSTSIVPSIFALHAAYPNPFNPITTLMYDLPYDNHVTLIIYDLNGREMNRLVNTVQSAGHKTIQWNATGMNGKPVSAGIYLYQIQSGEFVQTRKMVLLK